MSLVRVFPHRRARPECASWHWWMDQGDGPVSCPAIVDAWDYSMPLSLGLSASFRYQEVLSETGLANLDQLRAVAIIDCRSTQRRFVASGELNVVGSEASAELRVELPPGVVAQSLILSAALVLDGPSRTSRARIAAAKGSRLLESEQYTMLLEGDSGRFPAEPVAFSTRGFGPAPWTLMLSYEDVGDSFMGSVRLLINTEHPVGQAVLDPKTAGRYAGLMRADLMRGLITRLWQDGYSGRDVDESSVVGVVDAMCESLLGRSLDDTTSLFENDPIMFELLLQRGLDPYRELVC